MRLLVFISVIAYSVNPFVCAKESVTLGRIIQGHDAMEDQFPYVVRLSVHTKNRKNSICGGALISPTWVLTAAHCVANSNAVKVHLGSIFKDQQKVVYNVPNSGIIIHPYYKSIGLYDDIALIKIPPTEINIVRLPRVSCLNKKCEKAFAKICGWGRTSRSGKSPNRLQWGRVQILGRDDCQHIQPNELGTAMGSISPTPCLGDSGGPLVLERTGELVGIASGEICENGQLTSVVYTRVASYLHWIKSVSGVSYRSSL